MGIIGAWSSTVGSGAVSPEWADNPAVKKERERIEAENAELVRIGEIRALLAEGSKTLALYEHTQRRAEELRNKRSMSDRLERDRLRNEAKTLEQTLEIIERELLARGHE
jgi:hypothetical protein